MRTLLVASSLRPSLVPWRLSALFTLLASATLTGGILTLLRQQRSEFHDVLYTLAAAILLSTALFQASLAWRQSPLARRPKPTLRTGPSSSSSRIWFVTQGSLRALTGVVFCYLVTLATGPGPTAPYIFAAALMVCLTVLLLPFTAPTQTIDRWRRILGGWGPRRFARVLQIAVLASVVGELSLRTSEWLWETTLRDAPEPLDARMATSKPVRAISQRPDEYEVAVGSTDSSALRVAVLGDELAMAAANPQGAFTQLEAALPAIKCFHFGIPQAGPREYASHGLQHVRRLRPDLVLTFVSVADDIVGDPQPPSLFDWRNLSLARLLLRRTGAAVEPTVGLTGQASSVLGSPESKATQVADDWDAYVAACGPHLSVVRKPISGTMHQRWKTTLRYLDKLAETCRRENIPLALVIVPSPLQTNRPLLDAVCRREGCDPSDVDVELPQRRLAAYSADRKVPAFDLLPALRLCPEHPYVHQGWHWNRAGNEVAAQALTGWLQSTFTATLAARGPRTRPVSSADAAARMVAHRQ